MDPGWQTSGSEGSRRGLGRAAEEKAEEKAENEGVLLSKNMSQLYSETKIRAAKLREGRVIFMNPCLLRRDGGQSLERLSYDAPNQSWCSYNRATLHFATRG